MIVEEINKLDVLIKENQSFAVYRIPGENKLYISDSPSQVVTYQSINELNHQKGFVIAPFHITDSTPLVLIQATSRTLKFQPEDIGIKFTKEYKKTAPSPIEKIYEEKFTAFTNPIKDKLFKKLVLSRSMTIDREEHFSPALAFLAACVKYTRSYIYLCHTPQTGTWLGSTPEMLLSGNKNVWNTVAIAGTQPLQNGALPTNWDDKNLIEQMLVAYYIRAQLASFNIHASEKGPYTVRAGELAHLRSDYIFSLPDNNRLGDLLKLLHPTPAVSGFPKEKAFRFILENEGYNRLYYSGFIGWIDPDSKSDLYVNLRCMNIHEDTLTLYAGGGLLPSSVAADEWVETEDKLQTMLYLAKTSNYVFK